MLTEHAIDGGKRDMGGIDSTDLLASVLPVLSYSAQDSPFISFGEDLRSARAWGILNGAALVVSVEKVLTVDQGRPTRRDTVEMTPKITKNAIIMPFSTLLISLRFPSIFFFRTLEASASEASASRETSLVCGS